MLTGAGFEFLGKPGVIIARTWTTHTLTGVLAVDRLDNRSRVHSG